MQIDDIINKVFTRSFMGYDMREVDSFLDDIIDKLERYETERREMLTAMEYLLDKLEKGGALPEAKRSLPAGEEPPPVRTRGPRKVRGPKRESRPRAETPDMAAEAEIAVELELDENAPSMDDLFPELLETLSEMALPPDAADADEENAS